MAWRTRDDGRRFKIRSGATGRFENAPVEDRFWAKVDIRGPEECWNWMGAKLPDGYGQFKIGSGSERAHRVAWILTHGLIPEGKDILHSCNNTSCVNPNHLRPGTDTENVQQKMSEGRFVAVPGELNGNHILTEQEVREIRARYIPFVVSLNQLAREYNVSKKQILNIVHDRQWRGV
jgi:hypothetical protein